MSELQTYSIDRFEDNGLAVLENAESESLLVPQAFLPFGTKEGDILMLESTRSELSSSLTFYLNQEETERKKAALQSLRESLVQAPEGDIIL